MKPKTLRGEFAMAALINIASDVPYHKDDQLYSVIAQRAYKFADAMMAEREKQDKIE